VASRTAYLLSVSGLACWLGGCSGGARPERLPFAPPAPPGTPRVHTLDALGTQRNYEFRLSLPHRSPAVVEKLDRDLAQQGWVKAEPAFQQPGQRRWLPVRAGGQSTEGYDARWIHPKTGRVALLGIWYRAGDPTVQYGTFELFDAGQGM